MRFVVSTTLLQQKLQRIQGVVSTNTVLPILEAFILRSKMVHLPYELLILEPL